MARRSCAPSKAKRFFFLSILSTRRRGSAAIMFVRQTRDARNVPDGRAETWRNVPRYRFRRTVPTRECSRWFLGSTTSDDRTSDRPTFDRRHVSARATVPQCPFVNIGVFPIAAAATTFVQFSRSYSSRLIGFPSERVRFGFRSLLRPLWVHRICTARSLNTRSNGSTNSFVSGSHRGQTSANDCRPIGGYGRALINIHLALLHCRI